MAVDLTATGPWMPPEEIPLENVTVAETVPVNNAGIPAASAPLGTLAAPGGDTLTGTVTLHNANWKADYLAGHVGVDDATLHIDNGELRLDPVDFTYGPLKGRASVTLPSGCAASQSSPPTCRTQFQMQFADLDASALESALLGAREKGTLLSTLIDRLHPSTAPPWPQVEGTVTADSLVLGPVTLDGVSASLRIAPTGAEITSLDAGLFGGRVHLDGTLTKPATDRDKPSYTLKGDFQNLEVAGVGTLLGLHWTGSPLSGTANVNLSGYTDEDLAASAKGRLHFEVRQGSIATPGRVPTATTAKSRQITAALARFAGWTGDAAIQNGAIELGQNTIVTGNGKRSAAATITFATPPEVSFGSP
jgi:hypothetical protein